MFFLWPKDASWSLWGDWALLEHSLDASLVPCQGKYKNSKSSQNSHKDWVFSLWIMWTCIRGPVFEILYLPMYNVRSCIIRTLTFDHNLKRKIINKTKGLSLQTYTYWINCNWKIRNEFTITPRVIRQGTTVFN